MVWVFGNSHERIPIRDLNDTIYFRQKKQYSDQEFEGSKDLQREIQKGRVIKLDHLPEINSSLPDNLGVSFQYQNPSIDMAEIRRVITEVVSEQKSDGVDVKGLVSIITKAIRQEISKIQIGQGGPVPVPGQTKFVGPEYVPDVKLGDFKGNIEIKSKQVEGSGVLSSLDALKRLNKST